jgi:hypothetical protein
MRSISSHEYDIFRRCMIAARKEAQLTQESLAKSLQILKVISNGIHYLLVKLPSYWVVRER